MTAATMHLLGDLEVETLAADEPSPDLESPPQTMHRPARRPLRNDGLWHFWMLPGESYQLTHDGTGWRVTCRSWPGDHTYRLADADGDWFVGTLPLAGAVLVLLPDQAYLVQEASPHRWAAYEITS